MGDTIDLELAEENNQRYSNVNIIANVTGQNHVKWEKSAYNDVVDQQSSNMILYSFQLGRRNSLRWEIKIKEKITCYGMIWKECYEDYKKEW